MNKLSKCDANKMPLTPITFLKRAAMFYGCRNSIIYGSLRFSWEETYNRCRRFASSLQLLGVAKNDVVSVLAPNIPALYEMHFGVPMAGAILNAINTRLDANTIKTILDHSETKLIFVDYEHMPLVNEAINLLKVSKKSPRIIMIKEMEESINNNTTNMEHWLSHEHDDIDDYHKVVEYEELINYMGNNNKDNDEVVMLEDEWDPITLNYTSGTTSSPKGVVYTHRGAYLTTLSVLLGWEMGVEPVYLWSLPMFHGNGWTFPWGIAARGGTNICMRNITAAEMYKHFAMHGVTHMCCAPVVLKMILQEKRPAPRSSQIQILTGGAPPPRALLKEMANMGFHVMQTYGLTEASGSVLFSEWSKEWDSLSLDEKAKLKARQGVTALHIADIDVTDVITMQSVPKDGKTTGEIVIRGSGIMKEYFKEKDSTSAAFANKWLHTGDMGVIHPDGYIEIKDRLKDIIISGGENISSVAVEQVIRRNTKVSEVAVVAMPHPHWGESPCAFVVKKIGGGEDVTEEHIFEYCRNNLPHYMVPKKIAFVKELPMTSTGKVQKGVLRAIAMTFKVPITVKDEIRTSQKTTTSRL